MIRVLMIFFIGLTGAAAAMTYFDVGVEGTSYENLSYAKSIRSGSGGSSYGYAGGGYSRGK